MHPVIESRADHDSEAAPPPAWLLALAPASLGLAIFSHKLTASSLFSDEAFSWHAGAGSLGDVLHRVTVEEVAPPGYYLLLHGWMSVTASDSEATLRWPSVVAGTALVAAVFWLAWLVGGRRAGLAAASLAAISPLVLVYAQQARAYMFAMLAVTLAVAAGIKAERSDEPTRRTWVAGAAAAAAAAVLLHYTALLVLVPWAGWIAVRSTLSTSGKAALIASIAIPAVALAPLAADQLGRGHQVGVEPHARFTSFNVATVVGTPFATRGPEPLAWAIAGAAVVVLAAAIVLRRPSAPHAGERLLLLLAAVPVGSLMVLTVLGQSVLISRYSAVAAPVMLALLGAAVARLPRVLALAGLALATGIAVHGVLAAYRPSGHYADHRQIVERVAREQRAGDTIVAVGSRALEIGLTYYAERLTRPRVTIVRLTDRRRMVAAMRARRRLWFVSAPIDVGTAAANLRRLGYRLVEVRTYDRAVDLQLTLAQPARPAKPSSAPASG